MALARPVLDSRPTWWQGIPRPWNQSDAPNVCPDVIRNHLLLLLTLASIVAVACSPAARTPPPSDSSAPAAGPTKMRLAKANGFKSRSLVKGASKR